MLRQELLNEEKPYVTHLGLSDDEFAKLGQSFSRINERLREYCSTLQRTLTAKEDEAKIADDLEESDFVLDKKTNKNPMKQNPFKLKTKESLVLNYLQPVRDNNNYMNQPLYHYWLNIQNQMTGHRKTTFLSRDESFKLYKIVTKSLFNIKGILPSGVFRCFSRHPGFEAVGILEDIECLLKKHFPDFPDELLKQGYESSPSKKR